MRNLLIATTFLTGLPATSGKHLPLLPTTVPTAVPTFGNVRENSPATQALPKRPLKPLAGANSFTQAQAKSGIAAHGLTAVGPLAKDEEGIWRDLATKDGQQTAVTLDFQGNVHSDLRRYP